MRKTKLETRNPKLGVDGLPLRTLPLFAFRLSLFVFSSLWQFVRAVTGDDAYERYLERKQNEGAAEVLSRREFYRRSLERRYNSKTPSRCC